MGVRFPDEMTQDTRVAVITGGSSGIGRGIATGLAGDGIKTVIADVERDPKQGDHYHNDVSVPTDEHIESQMGVPSHFVETDVSNETDVETLIEGTLDKFGRLDILVNNAGILIPGTSQEISKEGWDRVIDVNLTGCFLTTKYAIPHLTDSDHGRIVNISSINAHFGGAGGSYAATKAGIVNLTRDFAVELAPEGVTVNAVLPGVIKTPLQDLNDEETRERQAQKTPLPRIGEPRDIANAVRFFVSEKAEWITGADLLVDGGYLAGGF